MRAALLHNDRECIDICCVTRASETGKYLQTLGPMIEGLACDFKRTLQQPDMHGIGYRTREQGDLQRAYKRELCSKLELGII